MEIATAQYHNAMQTDVPLCHAAILNPRRHGYHTAESNRSRTCRCGGNHGRSWVEVVAWQPAPTPSANVSLRTLLNLRGALQSDDRGVAFREEETVLWLMPRAMARIAAFARSRAWAIRFWMFRRGRAWSCTLSASHWSLLLCASHRLTTGFRGRANGIVCAPRARYFVVRLRHATHGSAPPLYVPKGAGASSSI